MKFSLLLGKPKDLCPRASEHRTQGCVSLCGVTVALKAEIHLKHWLLKVKGSPIL